nr:hypothetical protein MTCCP1_00033 [uncultured bacterium]
MLHQEPEAVHIGQARPVAASPSLRELFDRAVQEYRTSCFWNCRPSYSDAGLDVVVSRLRKHGDLKAWNLADQIDGERRHAA